MLHGQTEADELLAGFASPLEPVQGGVPAYGLSLGVGGQYGAAGPIKPSAPWTNYALTFACGIIAGALLTIRVAR